MKRKHLRSCLSFYGERIERIHFAESSKCLKIAIWLYFYLRIDVNPLRFHVSLRDMQHSTWFCAKLVEKTLPLHSLPNTHVKWAFSNCYWLQIVKHSKKMLKGANILVKNSFKCDCYIFLHPISLFILDKRYLFNGS